MGPSQESTAAAAASPDAKSSELKSSRPKLRRMSPLCLETLKTLEEDSVWADDDYDPMKPVLPPWPLIKREGEIFAAADYATSINHPVIFLNRKEDGTFDAPDPAWFNSPQFDSSQLCESQGS